MISLVDRVETKEKSNEENTVTFFTCGGNFQDVRPVSR